MKFYRLYNIETGTYTTNNNRKDNPFYSHIKHARRRVKMLEKKGLQIEIHEFEPVYRDTVT